MSKKGFKEHSLEYLVKKANIEKFNMFDSYEFLHSEVFNIFEAYHITKVLACLSKNIKRAIDLGCGSGNVLEKLVEIFEFNVGIDISSKSLLKAKEKLFYRRNQVNFIRADVENLPFRSCVFNIVTTYSLLHHLPNLRKFIYEVNRILVLGGYFIAFHEPNIYELRKVYEKGPIFKFLNLLYYKFCLRYFMKRYKGAFLRHLLEKAIRFKNLGNLEELADIHAKKGFSKEAVERLFLEAGFSKVKIKQRVQDFMWVFSRFSYPLKLLSCIDFIFPIILTFYKKFLPLIMIEAKK